MASQPQPVTSVTEDYLKALWSAEMRGDGMSVNQLAAKMGVVASTASENVARLKALGLVEHQPYRKVHLSVEGREVAVGMIRRHRIIETYLHQALGFDWDEIHVEAEILEHAISDRLLDRVDHVLGRPTRDPHGDPIPAPDGSCVVPPLRAFARLGVGEVGVIARIADKHPHVLRNLHALGATLDAALEVRAVHEDGSRAVRAVLGGPHRDDEAARGGDWLTSEAARGGDRLTSEAARGGDQPTSEAACGEFVLQAEDVEALYVIDDRPHMAVSA